MIMLDSCQYETFLKLSSIQRWGILEMSKPQSVAEHSFNVAIIANELLSVHKHDIDPKTRSLTFEWALVHDVPESMTGDIPTPTKKWLCDKLREIETDNFPDYAAAKELLQHSAPGVFVKVADWIEAYVYARKFCVDDCKEDVMSDMIGRLRDYVLGIDDKDLRRMVKKSILDTQDAFNLPASIYLHCQISEP